MAHQHGATNMEEKSLTFRGHKTVYWTTKSTDTEAILFLHGWACSSETWPSNLKIYQKYRCIMLDFMGHGQSDKPTGYDYAPERFVRQIDAVLEAEGITKVVCVGHSMGGPLSTLFTRLYTEKCLGIVYIETFLVAPQNYMTMDEREAIPNIFGGDKFFGIFDAVWTDKTAPDQRERILRVAKSCPDHVRMGCVTTHSWPSPWKVDEKYDIPCVLLEADPTMVSNFTPEFKLRFPQLKVVKWSGNSHFLFVEDPEKFDQFIDGFVESHHLLKGH